MIMFDMPSQDEGEHGFASLGVSFLELLLVTTVLVQGPLCHLHDREDSEQVGRVVASQH